MNKKTIIAITILIIAIVFLGIKALGNGQEAESASVLISTNTEASEVQKEGKSLTQEKTIADKIEVVHFHGTHQCWSCITVGEYALQTVKDKFPEEYQSGKIVFKDINGELAENQEIVMKYQSRGSSLFVNAISNDKDSIEEDTTVWRLVNDQEKFTDYFENKLKTLLGK
ncbi:MAG TPA: nitrophenyl compound nitroreductase subunit ArsF family protein [Candidatus Bathyarchaeia archaeon]|nr:nitrophenyl compound nitroreductase subunit ArsF family protein [Candidatus Bathyarchaeia archaeon]